MSCNKVSRSATWEPENAEKEIEMPTKELSNERLGKRFCVVVDGAGWDVPTTAALLGVSIAQVYKYMKGTTVLPRERARIMAEHSVKDGDLVGADADAVRSFLLGANLGLLFGNVGSPPDDSAMGGHLNPDTKLRDVA